MTAASLPAPPYVPPRFEPERDASGEIIYPSTDGLPMAWTTKHYDLLTYIKDGLEVFLADRDDVFVAGDLFWYPVEGHPEIVVAPDVFVAVGRPKGPRRSYRQWVEGGVAPQVVFEVLSEGNTANEMVKKMGFYTRHGVQEYVIFDPDDPSLEIWARQGDALLPVDDAQGWTSPTLGITYWIAEDKSLYLVKPDGQRLLTHIEQAKRAETERERAETERERAETEKQRAETERERAETERERAEKLAAKLRAAGIDPDEA
ncbi:MAG: Uma2 family endonuclease [Verrucomicrobiales bacterium]